MSLRFLFAAIAAALLLPGSFFTLNAAPLRVLYFTKSSAFEHSVIKRTDGQPSYSERILARLGTEHDFTCTFSKDGSLFSKDYLSAFDVIVFYTSGDLFSTGTDGQPPMTAEGKAALLDAIAGGKGFVGLHSCSDSFHTGESGGGMREERGQRFKNYGEASDPFIKMLGGEFIRHGPQQQAVTRVTSPHFPGFEKLGAEFTTHEEWYSLKDFAHDLHVLLILETNGMKGGDYARPPFPVAWVRVHGQGRVAYNAMGHREDVWDSAAYQSMLIGAINWAGKRASADPAPNLETTAPGHTTLPPFEKLRNSSRRAAQPPRASSSAQSSPMRAAVVTATSAASIRPC
ncbi:MAG: ThuA domain-containing protein [Nibricoccus sp.]